MNVFLNSVNKELNQTVTANGDVAYKSVGNAIIDFFYFAGATRQVNESKILEKFVAALNENEELAIRTLLYARDIREGMGERRLTRICLDYLAKNYDKAILVVPKIVELGRWDDLLSMIDGNDKLTQAIFNLINEALRGENPGLVAKWMPRKGLIAARIYKFLGYTERDWRKLLVSKTNVVENKMCARQWTEIDYSGVPSVASGLYSHAFGKHDPVGYGAYIESVKTGKVNTKTGKVEKINTDALYPYNVVGMSRDTAQVAWDNLKDFVGDHSFIPMIDVSGSMSGYRATDNLDCMSAAISLGVYLAQRNKSAFKNLAMTFSANPQWVKIKEKQHIHDIFNEVRHSQWDMNTNLDAAMDKILDTAVKNEVSESDMPQFLIVLSDMQFDAGGARNSVAERTKQKFEEAGYKMPNIIWWNLNSSYGTMPIGSNEKGMILASGFSPSIMSNILSGEVTPEKIVLNVIMKERYDY